MFYENLCSLLRERKESVSYVCQQLGLSKSTGTNWKNGSLPKSEQLIALSQYLGVSIDFLIFGPKDQELNYNIKLAQEIAQLNDRDKLLVMDMIKTMKYTEGRPNS